MQGIPAGHVTSPAIGLSLAQQLKAIGNGVNPPQAVEAIHRLIAIADIQLPNQEQEAA